MKQTAALNSLILLIILTTTACGNRDFNEAELLIPAPPVFISQFPLDPEDMDLLTLEGPAQAETDIPLFNEYIISLDFEPNTRIITGIAGVRYTNRTDIALNQLVFRAALNAIGYEYDFMNISHVFQENEELLFVLESTILIIDLLRPLEADETTQIHIHFEAYIPMTAHRSGANDHAIWAGAFLPVEAVISQHGWYIEPFYPVGTPFILDVSNYTVEITTPIGFAVAGTGLKTETYLDYNKITTFTAQVSRDFAFAISPYFQRSSIMSPSGLVEISFYHYSPDLPIEHILNIAAETLTFFEEAVGAYPYPQLCIVETDMLRDSESFSAIIFMDSGYLRHSGLSPLSSLRQAIARQWFSQIIGGNPIEEAWLKGGLAFFLQDGLLNHPDLLRREIEREYRVLQIHLTQISNPENRRLSTHIGNYDNWQDYIRVQQRKAKIMFYSLYRKMGQENFNNLLREYYRQFAFEIATAKDFITLAEEIHGEPLQNFFDHWLYTIEMPELPYP